MGAPDDPRLSAQVRAALVELRLLGTDALDSALADYEPLVAAAARRQLADEVEAMLRLQPLSGDDYDRALGELDPTTREGVQLFRDRLVEEDPLLGTMDHDFRFERMLGVGGGGRVYLVERQSYPQTMALKLIAGWDQASRRRSERERSVLARMNHPFIVQMADAWERPDGHTALLMEFVDGEPITVFADHHQLPIPARLELLELVCRAVAYAHQLDVLHRDLKPANILVMANGVPKVLDFGIARVAHGDRTNTAGFQGTLAYASPEQLRQHRLDQRSDVYSLGVILCELLLGRRPHQADGLERLGDPGRPAASLAELFGALGPAEATAIAERRRTTSEQLARTLRGELALVTAKALHPEVARRYPSVTSLARDLAAVRSGEPIEASADSLWYGLQNLVMRNRVASSFAALLIAALLLLAWSWHWAVREIHAARREATTRSDDAATAASGFVPAAAARERSGGSDHPSTSDAELDHARQGVAQVKQFVELLGYGHIVVVADGIQNAEAWATRQWEEQPDVGWYSARAERLAAANSMRPSGQADVPQRIAHCGRLFRLAVAHYMNEDLAKARHQWVEVAELLWLVAKELPHPFWRAMYCETLKRACRCVHESAPGFAEQLCHAMALCVEWSGEPGLARPVDEVRQAAADRGIDRAWLERVFRPTPTGR